MPVVLLTLLLAAPEPDPLTIPVPFVSRFPKIAESVPLPDHDDLWRFPTREEAETQFALCWQHRLDLLWLRGINGYSGGAYDAWIAEMDFRLACWQRVAWAHTPVADSGDWKGRQLRKLQELLGPADYAVGWRPELIPAGVVRQKMPLVEPEPG